MNSAVSSCECVQCAQLDLRAQQRKEDFATARADQPHVILSMCWMYEMGLMMEGRTCSAMAMQSNPN
eukprot:scaffold44876_cov18-Tisochrysis_lutea.AAC.2